MIVWALLSVHLARAARGKLVVQILFEGSEREFDASFL